MVHYAFLVLSRVDADEARAPRPRASDAARSSSRFAAPPRRRRPKETLPVGRAVGAPGPVSRGQTSKAQSWLHKSNKTTQNSDAYRSYRAVKLLDCGGWLACL